MKEARGKLIILLIGIFFGFIVVRQFYLHQTTTKVTQPEEGNALAVEVAELIKTKGKLEKQRDSLREEHQKLSESGKNQKSASETIEKNLNEHKIIAGLTKIEGPGVLVTFDQKIESTQLVDLINALKNIGVEAIAINHQRFTLYDSVEQGLFSPPTTVEAIGKPAVLGEALSRKGGILEQIGLGRVEQRERLILPAAN